MSFLNKFMRKKSSEEPNQSTNLLEGFVGGVPTNQNMLDIIDGWNCAFPDHVGVKAGALHLYADPRISWAIAEAGGIRGKSILEIGPLEGGHSFLLQQQEPSYHLAIEANQKAFLKCLIAKELYPLRNVEFKLGDAASYLAEDGPYFDLIIASGVLYHLIDPLQFLTDSAQRGKKLFLWTHFIDESFEANAHDPRLGAFSSPVLTDTRFGFPVRFRKRRYHGADQKPEFCGGLSDEHIWLYRDDLLKVIRHIGFTRVSLNDEEFDRANGPACSIFAGR